MQSFSAELGVSPPREEPSLTLDSLTHYQSQMSRTRTDADTFLLNILPKFRKIFERPTHCNSEFEGDAGEIYEFKPDPGFNMLQLNMPEHQGSDPHLDPYTQISQSALIPTFAQSIHQVEKMSNDEWAMTYKVETKEGLKNGDWAYSMSGTKYHKETGNKQTYTRAGIEGGQFWGPQSSFFAWDLTTETPDGYFMTQHGNGAYEVQLDSPSITVDERGVPHKDDKYRAAIATSVGEPEFDQRFTGPATKEVDSSVSTEMIGGEQAVDPQECEG